MPRSWRPRSRALLSLVLFCCAGLAPTANAQTPASTGKISGRVMSTLGTPVPKATVRLTQSPRRGREQGAPPPAIPPTIVGMSGPDGAFIFEHLSAGEYRVQAERLGFSNQNGNPLTGEAFDPQVTLTEGETKADIVLKLSPLASVSGRVTDPDGDPVQRAEIWLLRFTTRAGQTEPSIYASGASDDRGMFRIINVEPGRYFLKVDDLLSRPSRGREEIRVPSAQDMNLTTFYPSAPDTRAAVELALKPATEATGIDVRLIRGRVFTVSGVIVDATGAALAASLALIDRSDSSSGAIRFNVVSNASTGAFSFEGVPPGVYLLSARSAADGQSGKPIQYGRQEVVVGDRNRAGLRVQLSTGLTLTGRVIVPEGRTLGSNVVTMVNGVPTETPSPGTITLNDVGDQIGNQVGQLQPDGSFSISNLAPSRYTIYLNRNAGYLKSVVIDGKDVTTQYLDMTVGAPAPLQITLGNQPAQISGIAQNSNGQPAVATVVAWLKSPHLIESGGSGGFVRSDNNGKFNLRQLPPGEYYVAAFENANQYLQFPDYLARFNGSLTAITVAEDAKETVEPKWIPREATDREAANYPK